MTKTKPKSALPETVSAAELCWLLDLSISAVTLLEREGTLVKAARDAYSLESVPRYVRALRKRGEGPASWQKARTELTVERARFAKMQRLEREGHLLPRDVVEVILGNNNRTVRDALLGLGARLAAQLHGARSASEVQALLDGRVREILTALSEQSEPEIMRRIEQEAARRAKRQPVQITNGGGEHVSS
jgi:hypothetical protein